MSLPVLVSAASVAAAQGEAGGGRDGAEERGAEADADSGAPEVRLHDRAAGEHVLEMRQHPHRLGAAIGGDRDAQGAAVMVEAEIGVADRLGEGGREFEPVRSGAAEPGVPEAADPGAGEAEERVADQHRVAREDHVQPLPRDAAWETKVVATAALCRVEAAELLQRRRRDRPAADHVLAPPHPADDALRPEEVEEEQGAEIGGEDAKRDRHRGGAGLLAQRLHRPRPPQDRRAAAQSEH
ncbi:hypothetical protein E2493_20490 [Sphingomonas parva]|uniref:Uncharacterized protein n=1 Tax=Sphingomonas parva TaxID=2555898 RepID=A0A4Y8ZNK1_9SPHN|nr:hypothetical protein [Sphingomonas parva]TFI56379.1 hypothetical protein E2493_20490 [Sphingomonas parva]